MRIAYDNIIFGLQRTGGISVYWAELLRRANPAECLVIEPGGATRNLNWQPLSGRFSHRLETVVPASVDRYLPVRSPVRGYDVLHSSYYRVSTKPTPLVVTVYDFAYERYRGGLARRVHSTQKYRAVRRAQRLICISESARRDLLAYCGADLDERSSVVHLGVSEQFQPRPQPRSALLAAQHEFLASGRPYLLFVGGRHHYKRFTTAVAAAARLPDYDLVVIGGEPWSADDVALVESHALAHRVHRVGTVREAALPLWYSGAHALLYLSAFEGFGLPVLEAAMCDCPVIAQNTSAIPEVHGCPSLLLEHGSPDEVVDRVRLLEVAETRRRVIEDCRAHASAFTWDRCWRETQRLYESV